MAARDAGAAARRLPLGLRFWNGFFVALHALAAAGFLVAAALCVFAEERSRLAISHFFFERVLVTFIPVTAAVLSVETIRSLLSAGRPRSSSPAVALLVLVAVNLLGWAVVFVGHWGPPLGWVPVLFVVHVVAVAFTIVHLATTKEAAAGELAFEGTRAAYRRRLDASETGIAAAIWVLLLFTLPNPFLLGEIQRILLLAVLVTTRLGLTLVADTHTSFRIAERAHLLAALLVAASFFLRPGPLAAALTLPWLAFSALRALAGVERFRRRERRGMQRRSASTRRSSTSRSAPRGSFFREPARTRSDFRTRSSSSRPFTFISAASRFPSWPAWRAAGSRSP